MFNLDQQDALKGQKEEKMFQKFLLTRVAKWTIV
jgi:hypothetical protein